MKPPSPCTGSSTAHATDSGSTLALEQALQPGDRVVLGDPAERVRGGCAVDLGRERAEALLVGHDLRGHRHRQERPAVEGVVEDDHGGPAGRGARDLDGVLDRLGAAVDQDRLLLVAAARRELGEPAAHVDVRLVHADHEALVQVPVDLGVHGLDDRMRRMAEVRAADPAGEVDVLVPVDVPDARTLGARDDERRSGDALGDVPLAGLPDARCRRLFLQRHGRKTLVHRSIRCARTAPWPSG